MYFFFQYSSLTCHNLTKRYAAFVKADPIKWMKNVPENVTAECSELFMQAVAESGLTNDKIEQVIKAVSLPISVYYMMIMASM